MKSTPLVAPHATACVVSLKEIFCVRLSVTAIIQLSKTFKVLGLNRGEWLGEASLVCLTPLTFNLETLQIYRKVAGIIQWIFTYLSLRSPRCWFIIYILYFHVHVVDDRHCRFNSKEMNSLVLGATDKVTQ